jgi:membrane-associated phospholipid phosphatase
VLKSQIENPTVLSITEPYASRTHVPGVFKTNSRTSFPGPKPMNLKLLLLALVATGSTMVPLRLSGQNRDYTPIMWWHPVLAASGIALLFVVDEPVRDFIQDHRSNGLDDVGRFVGRFKEPEVFAVSGLGALAVGMVARQPGVARTGAQILLAYGLSSSTMIGTKWAFGRTRPSDTPDEVAHMTWFEGGENSSFPSGSAAVTFSLATTVADAIDHPVASVLLYTGATLNSWSRLNGDRHWLTDVTLGAVIGVTSAKLVNGRWRIFGLRPPVVLVGRDGGTMVGYDLRF